MIDNTNRKVGFSNVNKEIVATRGVKLKNKKAEAIAKEKEAKEEYKKKFEENADRTVAYNEEKGNRALDVISKFLKVSEDKTLAQNKGSIGNDVEREIRQDLIQLALDLNNDETEEDNGKGSVIALSVLSKIILIHRDRINELEYKLKALEYEYNQFKKDTSSRK